MVTKVNLCNYVHMNTLATIDTMKFKDNSVKSYVFSEYIVLICYLCSSLLPTVILCIYNIELQ